MKVRIRKHCKIKGTPAAPDEIHEVDELRAKALTDNEYAEPVEELPESPDTDPGTKSSGEEPGEEAADDTQDDPQAT